MSTPEQEEGYARCIDAMAEAARMWLRQHPFAEPQFHDFEAEVVREAGRPAHERAAIIAPLPAVIDRWAANTDTRSLLEAMEAASKGQGTYLQAKAILDGARENALKRASGKLPEGDWRCTGCGKQQNGFTNADGKAAPPGPGSMGVCSDCGELFRVNDAGTGYEALSTRALNQLPKSVRKQLLAMKATIVQRIAREQRRG